MRDDVQLQTVQLVRIGHDDGALAAGTEFQTRRRLIDWLPFVALVIAPTVLAMVYYIGFAANRYESELTYVVRTPGSAVTSELAAVVQGSSVMRSSDDAFLAKEYMLSRDAMQQLIDKDGLLAMFDQGGADILWRYPLFGKPTNDRLLKHYLNFVTVEYDHSSGVSTLTMQAFAPEDAQRLANALVDHTEAFLNGLNNRAQQDAINAAVRDVDGAKTNAYAALDAVTAFRNAEETLDPTKASAGIVSSISALSLETASANARMADLMTSAPQSPEIPTLRTRITALQDQIVKQRQQLGGDSSSLAPRIAEYERLLLQQQFAEKSFISALASLEAARLDASRQRIFLERVTNADLPDRAAYPHRVWSIFGVFAIGLMLWWIAHVIGKDSREHGRK